VCCSLDDWTPAAASTLFSKHNATGNQRGVILRVETGGQLGLIVSTDGVGATTYTSSVAPTVVDGAELWVRAALDLDNGSSNSACTFYTSTDGVTWSQLGTVRTAAVLASIFDNTAALTLGDTGTGGQPMAGRVIYAELRSGIGGSVVARFDAAQSGQLGYTDAVNSTVWTINRPSSGRKPILYDGRAVLSFATDDFLEVADHPALNFAAAEEFTVCALLRRFGAPGSSQVIAAKKTNGGADRRREREHFGQHGRAVGGGAELRGDGAEGRAALCAP
jgi:hypothetical protein